MIDSHCHLNFIEGCGSDEELVDEAVKAGVHTIINIGADARSSSVSVDLARRFKSVRATVGVHPHDAKDVDDAAVEEITRLAEAERVVAIGEIGLDFYRDLSPREVQKEVFHRFLQLAVETKLPVVIHTREAFAETIDIVTKYAPNLKGGVFHCFLDGIDDAYRVFDLGFLISVGGITTFPKAHIADVVREIPLDKLIIETDAPYLTPVPFRGKTNRPALVAYVYRKVAELKGLSFDEVERTVDRTCQKLFGLVDVFGE